MDRPIRSPIDAPGHRFPGRPQQRECIRSSIRPFLADTYIYVYIYIYLFIYFFFSDGLRVRASTLFTVRAAPSSFARRTLRPSTSFGADFLLGYQSATLVGLSAQPHHKVARYQVPVSAPRRVTCGARFDPGWQTNKVPRRCTRVHRGAARAQLRVSKA